MVTVVDVFALNVPPVGLADNQLAPSVVFALADQVPLEPQFDRETVCGGASLTFRMALNLSAFVEPVTQPVCTVKLTFNDSVMLLDWLENVTIAL